MLHAASPAAAPAPRRSRRRTGFIVGGVVLLLLLLAGGAAAAATVWSHASLSSDGDALARLNSPSFGATVQSVAAYNEHGHHVAIVDRGGKLYPKNKLATDENVTVVVQTKRPGWSSWALGSTETTKLVVHTPSAAVADRWPTVTSGRPVHVTFDAPVRAVALSTGTKDRRIRLRTGETDVNLGPQPAAGAVSVAAAPRTWERLPKPTTVTWFPAGSTPAAIVAPAAGSTFTPTSRVTVTYSRKPKTLPSLSVDGHGTWVRVDDHTVQYRPTGAGFGLGAHVVLGLPAGVRLASKVADGQNAASWTVPPGSEKRLQQLLADQGYIPLEWKPSGAAVGHSEADQEKAAVDAPAGRFAWRYGDTPSALKALWSEGTANDITRGALMAFQSDQGLAVDGLAGPGVWKAIIAAEIAGKKNQAGYSYVLVQRSVPQSLTLWHDGDTLLTTPANTGVPSAPTELGTFPVYERLASQTMEGTNPDGSHYSDPGIKWISYFNGGDAIHGFDRGSYGTPQSVGCVELPIPAAEKVWPHTPLGTLVTVAE